MLQCDESESKFFEYLPFEETNDLCTALNDCN